MQPDLMRGSIQWLDQFLASGHVPNVQFTVFNNADVPVGPFTASLYLSIDADIGPEDFLVAQHTVNGLNPRENSVWLAGTNAVPDDLPPGEYYYIKVLDEPDQIAEANESNNVYDFRLDGGSPIHINLPDLAPGIIDWRDFQLSPGQVPNVDFNVVNLGNSDPGSFVARLYLSIDRSIGSEDFLVAEHVVNGLGSLEASGLLDGQNPLPSGLPPGDYNYIVQVDYDDQILEPNETNNVFAFHDAGGTPVTIGGTGEPPQAPDDTITGPLAAELAYLAQAAYAEGTTQAQSRGWKPLDVPDYGAWHPVADFLLVSNGLLDNNIHFYEAWIDGQRTLAIAYSGTQVFQGDGAVEKLLSISDLVRQVGLWTDLYQEQRDALLAALDYAAGAESRGEQPFEQIIATGHSLGGILVEEMLADRATLLTDLGPGFDASLLNNAWGVTFGSPGSSRVVVDDAKLINFVTLGDPVAMLHSGGFLGMTVPSGNGSELGLGVIEAALSFEGLLTNPVSTTESLVAENSLMSQGFFLSREGTTVTILPGSDDALTFDSGLFVFRHFMDGQSGYVSTVSGLAERYQITELGAWRSYEGWNFVEDVDNVEFTIQFLQGLGLAVLDFLYPRLFLAGANGAVQTLRAVSDYTINIVTEVAEGVDLIRDGFMQTLSGTTEVLGDSFQALGEHFIILFENTQVGAENVSFEDGSVIIRLDLDLAALGFETTTTIAGDYDLTRFFVINTTEGTAVVYAENPVVNGTHADNFLIGAAAPDQMNGEDGDDFLLGLGGDDVLTGGPGDDALDGGANDLNGDIAVFSGPLSGYVVSQSADGKLIVQDVDASNGDDGTDTLANVELLRFADTTIDAPTDNPLTNTSITQLFNQYTDIAQGVASAYEVLLGGVPNVAGFQWLVDTAVNTNFGAGPGPVFNVENIFINLFNNLVQGNAAGLNQFNAVATGTTVTEKVTSIYQAIIPPSKQTPAGLDFITRSEGIVFYQAVANERGVAGADGAAIVAMASLVQIAVGENIGIGNAVRDLTQAVLASSDALPADGTDLTPIEIADGIAFDADDPAAMMRLVVANDLAPFAYTYEDAGNVWEADPSVAQLVGVQLWDAG